MIKNPLFGHPDQPVHSRLVLRLVLLIEFFDGVRLEQILQNERRSDCGSKCWVAEVGT